MYHCGDLTAENSKEIDIDELKDSLLYYDKEDEMELSICITMYNEKFIELLMSIAGIYRNYYELIKISEKFIDKVNIVIVCDGVEHLSKEIAYIFRFWLQNKSQEGWHVWCINA